MGIVNHQFPEDDVARVDGDVAKMGPRQCTHIHEVGHPLAGTRCRVSPMPGGIKCHNHAGNIRLARAAAHRKLLSIAEPAMEVLFAAVTKCELVEDPEKDGFRCLTHGDYGPCPQFRERISAAKDILDRSGFSRTTKMVLTSEDENPELKNLNKQQLAAELEAIAGELRGPSTLTNDVAGPVH